MDIPQLPKTFVLVVAYGARTAAQFALRHEDKLAALGLFDVALTPPVEQSQQKILAAQARQLLDEVGESEIVAKKIMAILRK